MSKPELKLIGEDGNVFAIIGKAVRVAKKEGWTEDEIKKFTAEMTSGDYDNALQVVQEHFDII